MTACEVVLARIERWWKSARRVIVASSGRRNRAEGRAAEPVHCRRRPTDVHRSARGKHPRPRKPSARGLVSWCRATARSAFFARAAEADPPLFANTPCAGRLDLPSSSPQDGYLRPGLPPNPGSGDVAHKPSCLPRIWPVSLVRGGNSAEEGRSQRPLHLREHQFDLACRREQRHRAGHQARRTPPATSPFNTLRRASHVEHVGEDSPSMPRAGGRGGHEGRWRPLAMRRPPRLRRSPAATGQRHFAACRACRRDRPLPGEMHIVVMADAPRLASFDALLPGLLAEHAGFAGGVLVTDCCTGEEYAEGDLRQQYRFLPHDDLLS